MISMGGVYPCDSIEVGFLGTDYVYSTVISQILNVDSMTSDIIQACLWLSILVVVWVWYPFTK